MTPVIPRKTFVLDFHFSKFRSCKPTTFQKNSFTDFFWSLVNVFKIDIKNDSW